MADTTFEEATRCPKCGHPGEDRVQHPINARGLAPGTTVHMIYCKTELCPWYETSWAVQVNPDGSVPPPTNHRGAPKVYAGFEDHDEIAKQIIQALTVQQELETKGHGEIRNPNAS